jgi:hypothetical protein
MEGATFIPRVPRFLQRKLVTISYIQVILSCGNLCLPQPNRCASHPDSAYLNRNGDPIMARHSHQFTIADDEAVRALIEKLVGGQASNQVRREKLLRALDDATRHYKDSNQKVRRAFFHGLLTGYAVALKLG